VLALVSFYFFADLYGYYCDHIGSKTDQDYSLGVLHVMQIKSQIKLYSV